MRIKGRVYQDGGLRPGVVVVEDGVIQAVEKSGAADLDVGDAAILPGLIDVHVHFREPGAPHKEDWTTGSQAAAAGGVTTVVDMPNTVPPTTTVQGVKRKADAAAKSLVDWGFWAGGTWYTEGLPALLAHCVGVKTYLGATTGDLLLDDQAAFPKILQAAADAGRPVALHAEAERVLQQLRRTEHAVPDHEAARPPLAEVESIYDAMKACARIRRPPRIHIAHASSHEAVHAATQAGFSIGSCPHHLLLAASDFEDALVPGYGKMNPPLRSAAARDALMADFAAGSIPILESDHAPHTQAEKSGDFHQAPAGLPGVETMGPLMLAQAVQGRVPLATVVDALTVRPAELIQADDRGRIAPGMKADLAVFDLDDVRLVDAGRLHSKCGWTPFEDHDAVFPSHVLLAGEALVEDGKLVGKPGMGRPLRPVP